MTDRERQQRVQEAMERKGSASGGGYNCVPFQMLCDKDRDVLADEVERLRGILLEAQRWNINPATGEPG